MAPNKAGGYTFKVSDKDMILRCLILGTDKNTYYSTARDMTSECIETIKRMIADGKGDLLVETIASVYQDGRAPKQDPTLMALAIASSCNDVEVRRKAYKIVSTLRTFSHIYTWKGYHKMVSGSKGFGTLSKVALCKLFESLTPSQLSYQVTKYPHRKNGNEDWSFLDLMRCIHLKGDNLPLEGQFVMKHSIKGSDDASKFLDAHPELKDSIVVAYMQAIDRVKALTDTIDDRVELIKYTYAHHLPREVMPTWALMHADVWRSLLLNREQTMVCMPMTALVRNLAVMTVRGVFDDALTTSMVVSHLTNETILKKARLHPVSILIAYSTYKSGHGEKGKLTWTPNPKILAALDDAFYKAFKFVQPTGKRIYHGIDCSGSMTASIPCLPQMSSHTAATVMCMVFARIEAESQQYFAGFTNQEMRTIDLKPSMKLDEATRLTQFRDFGTTDCSLPIENAIKDYKSSYGEKGKWDVFMIYTINNSVNFLN